MFPSPYGVLFILIGDFPRKVNIIKETGFRLLTEYYSFLCVSHKLHNKKAFKFPSPYGVLFILIDVSKNTSEKLKNRSFRLLTEYYSFLCT